MNEQELREKCGLEKDEVINTNYGYMDILYVKNDIVHYGFLATGKQMSENVSSFIEKMKNYKK